MDNTVTIDDTDLSITYEGNWFARSGRQDEFNTTSHGMGSGGKGTATFRFKGSSVAVFGTIDGIVSLGILPWTAKFSVDGGPSSTNTPGTKLTPLRKNKLYGSSPLTDGEHTLSISVFVPFPLGLPFWLDSIQYTPSLERVPDTDSNTSPVESSTAVPTPTTIPPPTSQLSTLTTAGNTSTTALASISTSFNDSLSTLSTQQSQSGNISSSVAPSQGQLSAELPLLTSFTSPTSSPSAAADQQAEPKKMTGAIVGAVLGGISLSIIAFALFCWRRRRPRAMSLPFSQHSTSSTSSVEPFLGVMSAPPMRNKSWRNGAPPPWSPAADYSDHRNLAISHSGLNNPSYSDSLSSPSDPPSDPPKYHERSKFSHG